MSAHVARVLRERREHNRQFVVIRRPEALADDAGGSGGGVEDEYGETVFDQMDDGAPLALSDRCYVPRTKCPWLCCLLGLALMGVGAAQCYFAFHADYYAALLFDAGGGGGTDRRQATATLATAAAAAAPAAAADSAAAAAQPLQSASANSATLGSDVLHLDRPAGGEGDAEPAALLLLLLRSFAYVGPTVVGTGAFIITVSFVIVLESRDRIIRAMRNREVERTSRNKEFIYNAVMKRFVNETAAKSDASSAPSGRQKRSPLASATAAAAAARAELAAKSAGQTTKASAPDGSAAASGGGGGSGAELTVAAAAAASAPSLVAA